MSTTSHPQTYPRAK
ncbi:hypothetical protein Tco_1197756, partial [Tanacetum coccineum]